MNQHDSVNHPEHYTSLGAACSQCGASIECIDVTSHMGFTIGNAVKYLWRAGRKGLAVEDLRKAAWYIAREIARLEAPPDPEATPPSLYVGHERYASIVDAPVSRRETMRPAAPNLTLRGIPTEVEMPRVTIDDVRSDWSDFEPTEGVISVEGGE